MQFGLKETEGIKKTINFLSKHVDEEGKLLGYQIATGIAFAVFGEAKGIDDEITKKILSKITPWVLK